MTSDARPVGYQHVTVQSSFGEGVDMPQRTSPKRGHPLASSPARLALAGDWHGDLGHARSVIGYASRQGVEGVVHLGDFGVWPGGEGRRYLDGVNAALEAAGVWLAFVDGNHEDFWQLQMLPLDAMGARPLRSHLWHLPRGLRWTWLGQTWMALGGATSLDKPSRRLGVSWWPEEEITVADARRAVEGGPVDHLVTHDCPAGVGIPGLPPASIWPPEELVRANAHRRLLRSVVDGVRPKRLWHGHFHSAYSATLEGEGYSTSVVGLNDNTGPFHENVTVLDLADPVGQS